MLPGETGHSFDTCEDCHRLLVPQVLRSAAGYYIGTACSCGPYSRESGYYSSREEAQRDLDDLNISRPRV